MSSDITDHHKDRHQELTSTPLHFPRKSERQSILRERVFNIKSSGEYSRFAIVILTINNIQQNPVYQSIIFINAEHFGFNFTIGASLQFTIR